MRNYFGPRPEEVTLYLTQRRALIQNDSVDTISLALVEES